MGRELSSRGLDPSLAINRMRSRSASRTGRKRERSPEGRDDGMDID
ncbi:nucleolar GTP-binding protein 1-like, partial [Trifolium medium]|nr:nucleolar GTP-binding protein 1-like [Trifolium medium]